MKLMLESEVLARHLSMFERQKLFFFGNVRDQFVDQVAQGRKVAVFTQYYDVFKRLNYQNACLHYHFNTECRGDLGVFYWLKNKQECQYLLYQWLAESAPQGQELLIVGENRSGVNSVEKMLAPYGDIVKIDAARRCSLYHFVLKKQPIFVANSYWKHYHTDEVEVFALPAVFSSTGLDDGTKLLLSTFSAAGNISGTVLDLGCGAGVIGATLKKRFPQVQLTMSDIHAMAIASSERTLAENQLSGKVCNSDVFSDLPQKFDLIVSNPPFHDGINTAYRAVGTLICEAKKHLSRGGELRIVANSHLPYPDLIDQEFGCHQVLAKTTKFKVYSAHV